MILTAGPVSGLKVTKLFASAGLAFFRVDAVDAKGTRVIACGDEVSVTVRNGTLVALDNGSPLDHTPFAASRRRLCRGSLVAIVRGGPEASPAVRIDWKRATPSRMTRARFSVFAER